MKVLVSACLLGVNCKYNGGNNRSQAVEEFIKGHEVIPVCPEVMGGLSTPRLPSEISNGIVTDRSGKNVDSEFRKGALAALEIAVKEQVDLAVLQSRSPSCGSDWIYDGTFSGTLITGNGIFVQMLKEAGIPVIDAASLQKKK